MNVGAPSSPDFAPATAEVVKTPVVPQRSIDKLKVAYNAANAKLQTDSDAEIKPLTDLNSFVDDLDVEKIKSERSIRGNEEAIGLTKKRMLTKAAEDLLGVKDASGKFREPPSDTKDPKALYKRVKVLAKLLEKEDYRKAFEGIAEQLRDPKLAKDSAAKKWLTLLQGGDHMVAYDVANIDNKQIDTGAEKTKTKRPDFGEIARDLPRSMWNFTKYASESVVANIRNTATHPWHLKEAIKTWAKNYDIREWKGRSIAWKAGAVVGVIESAYVAWMAPLPGAGNVKGALNFAAINGAMAGSSMLHGRKEAHLGKDYKAGVGNMSRGEFEERLFEIRSKRARVDGRLKEFGRGLAVGSGVGMLDATMLHNAAGISFTEMAAKAMAKPLHESMPGLPIRSSLLEAQSPNIPRYEMFGSEQAPKPRDLTGFASYRPENANTALRAIAYQPDAAASVQASMVNGSAGEAGVSLPQVQLPEIDVNRGIDVAGKRLHQMGEQVTHFDPGTDPKAALGEAKRAISDVKDTVDEGVRNLLTEASKTADYFASTPPKDTVGAGFSQLGTKVQEGLTAAGQARDQLGQRLQEMQSQMPVQRDGGIPPARSDGGLIQPIPKAPYYDEPRLMTAKFVPPDRTDMVYSELHGWMRPDDLDAISTSGPEMVKTGLKPGVSGAAFEVAAQVETPVDVLTKKVAEAMQGDPQLDGQIKQFADTRFSNAQAIIEQTLQQNGITSQDAEFAQAVEKMRQEMTKVAYESYQKSLHDAVDQLLSGSAQDKALFAKLSAKSPAELRQMIATLKEAQELQAKGGMLAIQIPGKLSSVGLSINEAQRIGGLVTETQNGFTKVYDQVMFDAEITTKTTHLASTLKAPATPEPPLSAPSPSAPAVSSPSAGSGDRYFSEPEFRAAGVSAQRLQRAGQALAQTIMTDPDVDTFLNTSINDHAAAAQQLLANSGIQSAQITPADVLQAREALKPLAGEVLNRSIDQSLAEAIRTINDPVLAAELQELGKNNPQQLAALVAKALNDPNFLSSPEGAKYASFIANVKSHYDQIFTDAIADSTLRGNIVYWGDQAINAAELAVDTYVRKGNPLPITQQQIDAVVQYFTNTAQNTTMPPVMQRMIDAVVQNPDLQKELADALNRPAGITIDTYGGFIEAYLNQQGLTLPDLSANGIHTAIGGLQTELTPYGDPIVDQTLKELSDLATEDTVNRLRAMQLSKLLTVASNAVEHNAALDPADVDEQLVREMMTKLETLNTSMAQNPAIRAKFAHRMDEWLEWFRQLNHTTFAVAPQAPDVAAGASQPADHAMLVGERWGDDPEFRSVAVTTARLQRLLDAMNVAEANDPDVQNFLTTSVSAHAQAAQQLLINSGMQPGQITPADILNARGALRSLAGDVFNKSLDDSLQETLQTINDPVFVSELQVMAQQNPAQLTSIVVKGLSDPNFLTSPEGAKYAPFIANVQSHFDKLLADAMQDATLKGNMLTYGDQAIDITEAAVDKYIRHGVTDYSAIDNVAKTVAGVLNNTPTPPVVQRMIAAAAQNPDAQKLIEDILRNPIGSTIDTYGQIFHDTLAPLGINVTSLTPDGLHTAVGGLQAELAAYNDPTINNAIQELSDALTPEQINKLRSLQLTELIQQAQDAMQHPGTHNDVSELVAKLDHVYKAMDANPDVHARLADESDKQLEWLRKLMHDFLKPQPAGDTTVTLPVEPGPDVTQPSDQPVDIHLPVEPDKPVGTPGAPSVPPGVPVENVVPPGTTMEQIQKIIGEVSREVDIKPGDTVGKFLFEQPDLGFQWGPEGARPLVAHMIANYPMFTEMWDKAGVSPEYRIPLTELPAILRQAESSDPAVSYPALQRMYESMRLIPAPGKFRVLQPNAVSAIMKGLGLDKE